MSEQAAAARTQLFTLRVWVEEVGNGRTEFRGTLKHVLSGETYHFRDWETLVQPIEKICVQREKQWGMS